MLDYSWITGRKSNVILQNFGVSDVSRKFGPEKRGEGGRERERKREEKERGEGKRREERERESPKDGTCGFDPIK